VAQALSQVFSGGGNGEPVALTSLPIQDARQNIILSRSFGFVPQKIFNFILMAREKRAVQENKSAWLAGALLFAGWTDSHLGRTPVFLFARG